MYHQPNHSHRPHDYEPRVRGGSSRAYLIGIVVAAAAMFGAFIVLTGPDEPTDLPVVQVPESPDSGVQIELPLAEVSDSHAVYSLQETATRFEMPPEVALRGMCGSGGGGNGWKVCLVEDDGVLAVIGTADTEDMLVVIEGSGVPGGQVSVSAGGGSIVGLEGVSGNVTITVFLDGYEAGELNGTLP